MKIILFSMGKENEAYVKPGIELFTQRLQNYYPTEWRFITPVKNSGALDVNTLRNKESEQIISMLPPAQPFVLLDERGKNFSSEAFAVRFQQFANEGKKTLSFVIGGAYGVNDLLRTKADLVWGLSSLIFPHQLVRLILAEQLYRTCTILKNEKYHHS